MNMQTPVGYTAKIEIITPDDAKRYLARNTENRTLRPYHVEAMARDHAAGRFAFNGDAIRFFDDGVLADGQHRLQMVVRTAKPLQAVVVRGLDRESMKSIDGGMRRTHGDRLNLAGVANGNRVAATISILNILAKGAYQAKTPTPTEVFDILARHPEIERAVSHCSRVSFGMTNIAAAFHYVGYATGRADLADEMVETIKHGTNGPDSPFFMARERIIKARSGDARMHRDGLIAITCAAWKAATGEKPAKRLNVAPFKSRPSVERWDAAMLYA